MLKNNFKCIGLYIIVIFLCILFIKWNDSSFYYSIIVYGESDLLLFFASLLFLGCGFLLKVQKKRYQDILSVLLLALVISILLSILAFEYDYISSILHQNTPDLKIFTEDLLGVVDVLCLPLWWFMSKPDSIQTSNQYYIIIAGIYPSTMILVGMQLKRFILLNKNQKHIQK